MPLWTAGQEVHVLELLGGNAWLNSSPEDNSMSHVWHIQVQTVFS